MLNKKIKPNILLAVVVFLICIGILTWLFNPFSHKNKDNNGKGQWQSDISGQISSTYTSDSGKIFVSSMLTSENLSSESSSEEQSSTTSSTEINIPHSSTGSGTSNSSKTDGGSQSSSAVSSSNSSVVSQSSPSSTSSAVSSVPAYKYEYYTIQSFDSANVYDRINISNIKTTKYSFTGGYRKNCIKLQVAASMQSYSGYLINYSEENTSLPITDKNSVIGFYYNTYNTDYASILVEIDTDGGTLIYTVPKTSTNGWKRVEFKLSDARIISGTYESVINSSEYFSFEIQIKTYPMTSNYFGLDEFFCGY